MARRLWSLLLAASLAAPAWAGPWPRAEGEGFASVTLRAPPRGDQGYAALYLEYGLRERLTLGLDAGRGIGGAGKTVVFLSRARAPGERRLRFAADLGIGMIDGRAALRPGLSIGRGFGGARRSGWIVADLTAEIRAGAGTDLKLDLTFGLTHASGRKTMAQLQTGRAAGDPPHARLEVAAVLPLRGRTSAVVGIFHDLAGEESRGLVVGLWRRF